MMVNQLFSLLALVATSVSADLLKRQGPNTVYPGHESQMTASNNKTDFLLPISKTDAEKLAGKYALLKPTGLPKDFLSEDQHLLYVSAGYQYDIRMLGLRVDQLSSVNFYIPFVDVLKDGKTPFSKPTIGYINQLIPVVVADLELNGQHVGVFDPKHAPYKTIGDGSELAITVSEGLDNPIDGPGLLIPRFQANFKKTSKAHISAKTFKEVALQPRVNPLGLCSQTIEYYNETFADPSHVVGSVQVYSPVVPQNQQFETAYGWTVTSEWIAPAGVGKKCSDFA